MNESSILTVLYDCISDGASLSGGGWEPDLPLTNMLTPKQYWRPARSVSTDPTDTWFNIDLGAEKLLNGVVLGPGNFSPAMTGTLTKFADAGFTQPVLDWDIPKLGTRLTWGTLPFGAANWYTHLLPWANPARRPNAIITFDQAIRGRYWRFEINDEGNIDGFLDIGRLFMAGAWVPRFNYKPDQNAFGIRDNTQRSTMLSGAVKDRRRYNPRYFSFQVEYLDDDDVFGAAFRLLDLAGFDQEIFLIPQPNDTKNLQTRSFFAHISQQDAIAQAQVKYAHIGFEATEIFS